MSLAISASSLEFSYPKRKALNNISFTAESGKIFGLVGPNGGGKSTTFKILSTLMPLQKGEATVLGENLRQNPARVRSQIGIVFQSPALDKKLTVLENMIHQGNLYGWSGTRLIERSVFLLKKLGLLERKNEKVESLSGGLKRRVEIAKALIHEPKLLILDEPTTGLDPLARLEVWNYLKSLTAEGITVLLTTHLLDEADKCDALAFLDQGKIMAHGSPSELKAIVGMDVITVVGKNPQALNESIKNKFHTDTTVVGDEVRIKKNLGHEFIPELVTSFPNEILSVKLSKPTLEDLFIQLTGRQFGEVV